MKNSDWFKNFTAYSLDSAWSITANHLEETLAKHPLLACNAASMSSQGWIPPHPSTGLVFNVGRHLLFRLGTQQRLLPTAIIAQAVQAGAKALEKQQGFAPGRKQLRDLKDRVADELRPKAFVRERSVRAWIDQDSHRLIIDTASPKMAENLASVLRNDLGELPAVCLETEISAGAAMTAWLAGGAISPQFALDQDCELVANELSKAAVRYVRHDLEGKEIRSLIQGGKTVSRVGLVWRDRLALVLTDKLVVKRLRFEAIDTKETGAAEAKENGDQFEANATLMTGELTAMMDDVVAVLGGLKA